MKYSFNAKLLKIRQEASDATLDSTKKDKQRDEVVTVSSDNDSDKEEANTDDEKKVYFTCIKQVILKFMFTFVKEEHDIMSIANVFNASH